MKEKRWLLQYFLIHLCLIIPVLMASVLIVGIVTDRMKKLEDTSAKILLDNVITNFEENYSNYYEESVMLSESLELLPRTMLDSANGTRKGIELLSLKGRYDNQISNIFIDYGTEYIYASSGVARKQIHFKTILSCKEESVSRGLTVLENGEATVIFLFKSDTKGYIMYSYPTRKIEDGYASVNFVMPYEQVEKMLMLTDEKQWYQLQAADGSTLSLGCDDLGKMVVIASEISEERVNSGNYTMLEKNISSMGMTIRMYTEKFSLNQENGMYQVQFINMVLIVVGALLSAVVSWILSKRRMNEILRLEKIARGDADYRFSQKNIYNRLQNLIVTGLSESKEHAMKLREQTAYLIFQGMTGNIENINEAFQMFGLSECPKRFFVGAISTATRLEEKHLPVLLKDSLHIRSSHEYLEVVVFLYELTTGDGNQMQRKKIAESIRTCLHQQGISKVRIGMSQTFTDPTMINCGYSEALSVLEYIVSGKISDYCGCWENVVQSIHFFLPDDAVLKNFSEALEEKNFEAAQKALGQLMYSYSANECTNENLAYVRYVILQCLVEYLRQESTVENTIFLKECLNINVRDEKKFIQTVENILKQSLVQNEEDQFIRMLNYVEKNYYRSDLSYEEVAEIGGISKTYVSKLFRKRLGVSYIEYLTSVRIDKAGTLLRTTDYSVNDIVKMVGYENAANFRRCFKEKYGISATDYRKRMSE